MLSNTYVISEIEPPSAPIKTSEPFEIPIRSQKQEFKPISQSA